VRKKYLPDYFLSGQTSIGLMNLSIVTTTDYCAPGNAGSYVIDIYGTMAGNPVSYDPDQYWPDAGSCLTISRFPYVDTMGIDFEAGGIIYNLALLTTGHVVPGRGQQNYFDGYLRAQLSSWNSTPARDIFAESDLFTPLLTVAPGASLPPVYNDAGSGARVLIVYLEFYAGTYGHIQLKVFVSSTSDPACPYTILDILGVHNNQQVTFDPTTTFQGRDNCIFQDPELFISTSGINYNAGGQTFNAYKAYQNGGWNTFITDGNYDNEWAYYQNITVTPTSAFVNCNPSFVCVKSVKYQPSCPNGHQFDPRVASQCTGLVVTNPVWNSVCLAADGGSCVS